MLYFGSEWPDDLPKTSQPVGVHCLNCNEPILENESGVRIVYIGEERTGFAYQHRECHLRGVFGSVGHQQKKCSCYGGSEEDPPGLTKRQAAIAAVQLYYDEHELKK